MPRPADTARFFRRGCISRALTGREVVEFYRRLRGAGSEATDRVLKFASLNGSSDRAVGTYSGGMVQRLGLAVAMVPRADILLLDEPTAALDPEGLCALYGLIEERRRDGAQSCSARISSATSSASPTALPSWQRAG